MTTPEHGDPFLSAAIMAHPSRMNFVEGLQEQLPDAEVHLDRERGIWDTASRAWRAFGRAALWHLVIQDDAVLCPDFSAHATEALRSVEPVRPVSFYLGGPRPHAEIVEPALDRAKQIGTPWLEMEGPWWGVAYALPVATIPEMLTWCDSVTETQRDERRIAWYFARQQIRCWYTCPSLVDHRTSEETPSLFRQGAATRQARWFVGEDHPPTDWEREPLVIPTTVSYP